MSQTYPFANEAHKMRWFLKSLWSQIHKITSETNVQKLTGFFYECSLLNISALLWESGQIYGNGKKLNFWWWVCNEVDTELQCTTEIYILLLSNIPSINLINIINKIAPKKSHVLAAGG